jgi:hypothetical protein
MTTTTLPCGAILTFDEATITQKLATLFASLNDAMMLSGGSSGVVVGTETLREAHRPATTTPEGSVKKWGTVHATMPRCGDVPPVLGADLSAPYETIVPRLSSGMAIEFVK